MAEQLIDVDLQPSQASYKSFETFFKKIENNEFDVKADFSGAEKEAKEFVKETEKVIENGLGDSLKAVENESKGIFANISDSVKSNFDNIIAGFAGGGGFGLLTQGFEFIAGSVGEAYTAANEFNTALLDIQAKTGATAQEMTVLEEAAKSAFLGGVGESLADATKTIGQAQTLLGDTFQGAELGDFTAKAQALGNLFDKDVNEVISKATPFIKQFGLSSDEAFNLLAKGLREGGTSSDDYLDSLAEYSQIVKETGLSAAEFTGILTRGAQEGIFNTDKLADSIKEIGLRIRAGDFENAFKDLQGTNEFEQGLINSVQAIARAGQDGTKTIQEVLEESTTLINDAFQQGEINQTLASQLQIAVAGTPAEDLGTDLFGRIFGAPLDEAAINASAQKIGEEVSNAVGQYTTFDALQRQVTLLVTTIGRDAILLFEGLLDNLTRFFSPVINLIGEIVTELEKLFESAGEGVSVFEILGDVLGFIARVVLTPLKLAITGILQGFKLLLTIINAGISIVSNFVKENKVLQSVFNAISKVAGILGSAIRSLLETLGLLDKQDIKAPFEELKEEQEQLTDTSNQLDESLINTNKNLKNVGKDVKPKTLDELINQLAQLRIKTDDLNNATAAQRREYDRILNQAQNLVKENKNLENSTKNVKFELGLLNKESDKFLKFIKDSQDKIVDIEFNLKLDELNRQVAKVGDLVNEELNLEGLDYSEAIQSTKEYFDNLKLLRQQQLKATIQQIEEQANIESIQRNKQFEKEKKDVENRFDEQIKLAKSEGREVLDLEEQKTNELTAINEKYNRDIENAAADKAQKVLDIEKENNRKLLEDEKKQADEEKKIRDKRQQDIIDSVSAIGGEYGAIAEGLTQQFFKLDELLNASGENWTDYASIVSNSLAAISQSSKLNAEAQKALAVSQATINTAVAVTKVYPNIPLSILIGALGAAQIATILGAEDGVVGLTSSYNKKPGKTDTLPFLLAPGESVINSKATAINKPFLEYANKGGDLGALFGGMASKIDITNERLISLEKAMYKAKFSKQSFNLVVENKNNSKISGAVRV